jgi:hypothetical protein
MDRVRMDNWKSEVRLLQDLIRSSPAGHWTVERARIVELNGYIAKRQGDGV